MQLSLDDFISIRNRFQFHPLLSQFSNLVSFEITRPRTVTHGSFVPSSLVSYTHTRIWAPFRTGTSHTKFIPYPCSLRPFFFYKSKNQIQVQRNGRRTALISKVTLQYLHTTRTTWNENATLARLIRDCRSNRSSRLECYSINTTTLTFTVSHFLSTSISTAIIPLSILSIFCSLLASQWPLTSIHHLMLKHLQLPHHQRQVSRSPPLLQPTSSKLDMSQSKTPGYGGRNTSSYDPSRLACTKMNG